MISALVSFIQRVVQVALVACVLLTPQTASANGWQDAYNAWSSGRMGEDMLNALGTNAAELTDAWENRGEFVAGMGEEITSGRAGGRMLQFGGGLAQGAWGSVVETAALAWDGAAFLALGGVWETEEGGLVDQYEPASKLVQAYKYSDDPGATTLAILQGLAELPGEFVDGMWNDPNKAGRILGGFLVPMAGKGVSRLGGTVRRAVVARGAPTSNPCAAICPVPIVADLAKVTTPRPTLGNPLANLGAVRRSRLGPTLRLSPKVANSQYRHVFNHRDWLSAKNGPGSYFKTKADAQSVLDAVNAGRGTFLGKTKLGNDVFRVEGMPGGFNHNPSAGFLHQPTDVFIVKGTTKVSVVPTSPTWISKTAPAPDPLNLPTSTGWMPMPGDL